MATESPKDEILLKRIKEGDSSAFATLVRRHNEKYYRLSYRYMANREEAEDITQMAFIKLWENPNIWNPGKGVKFTTWFYRIVVNLCLDKKKKHDAMPMPEEFEISDDSNNQEDSSAAKQEGRLLKQELALLPDRQKTAMILCFYEERSHDEAAEIMKVNVKALQSLIMRAKTTLKEKMKRYYV